MGNRLHEGTIWKILEIEGYYHNALKKKFLMGGWVGVDGNLSCNIHNWYYYCGDTHTAALLPLSVHQATHQPSQQQLNRHSKPLSHSLLLCLLPQTKKMAHDKRNYLLEATPISSANQPMAEQADQQ